MDDKVRLIDANALMKKVCGAECGTHFKVCDLDSDNDDVRCVFRDYVKAAPTIEAQSTKPMFKLIEHIQMMLTTIYDTGGCIQSEDMKCLIETSDRLKELVKGSGYFIQEDGE